MFHLDAYNEGIEAKIAGLAFNSCPYQRREAEIDMLSWMDGWKAAHAIMKVERLRQLHTAKFPRMGHGDDFSN